ncbi:membrane protein FAM174A-like isoform X3 [Nilaparvata lugens]|uniref:membrane protein FAM174A-like isoform X1 n=1 Tax=Nilaparvata lugens TaxID=108931 RepID=UPI00193DF0AC|nr:membrane protein FAM174A-like isoform X1 [Nilaparvata lugens]XP_039277056.1 membrane protein FAM174A-like isoform X2 [Nilaparvata lugens]XP_039277057.1 membrane protein FAM174A-like isoform X3 [Nilaparvata lugens]
MFNDTTVARTANNSDIIYVGSYQVDSTTLFEFFCFLSFLSFAILCYTSIKAMRLRRGRRRVRKYGILASREDVEMTPLGEEDEDEDSTVFDINNHARP